MKKVKISSKYQIVIPKEIRDALKLEPGQEVMLMNTKRSITLIPVRPIEKYFGMLKGRKIDYEDFREKMKKIRPSS